MPQISPRAGHTLSSQQPLVTYSGSLKDFGPVCSVNSLHPLSIWLCVDGWWFVCLLSTMEENFICRFQFQFSIEIFNFNFNAFSFPIKVLKARRSEMTCFLGKIGGTGPLFCRKHLGLLLHSQAAVLTPGHPATSTVLVLVHRSFLLDLSWKDPWIVLTMLKQRASFKIQSAYKLETEQSPNMWF